MSEPTRVQQPDGRRFTTLGVVLACASGFLVGVLLVAVLGGAKGRSTETVTVARTTTVTVPAEVTTGGTVIVTTTVPPVIGERLDVASERIVRSGFEIDVDGGGLLGVLDESNWEVVDQSPEAGTRLEQGSTVQVTIDRR